MFEVYKIMGTDFEGNAVLVPEDPADEYEQLQANLSVADEFQGYSFLIRSDLKLSVNRPRNGVKISKTN